MFERTKRSEVKDEGLLHLYKRENQRRALVRVTTATPPLEEKSGDETILTFNFWTLPLYKLEAEEYLQKHLTCMYPLLPTMQGVTAEMIGKAMEELAALYREDEVTLAQQFVWMELLLARAGTLPLRERRELQRRLSMYDPLWENHPKVKQIRADARAKAKEEAKAEIAAERARLEAEAKAERARLEAEKEALVRLASAEALQKVLLNVVQARFPELKELAQQRAASLNEPGKIELLIEQITAAPDEQTARWLLKVTAA